MATKDQPLYVGLASPADIRRELLLSQKGMITCLKKYESFKETRKKKIETIAELKKTLADTHTLIRKFRQVLPKTQLKAQTVVKPAPKPKEVKPVKKVKEKVPQEAQDTLSTLEGELRDIEKKLEKLA